VELRVDLGGVRIIQKKDKAKQNTQLSHNTPVAIKQQRK
jgi:hypothetical protein